MARNKSDPTGAAPAAEVPNVAVVAYKGFDRNLVCNPNDNPFQFEIGGIYSVEGKVEACSNGFHACPNPLDVFKYYPPTSRFCVVELSGEMDHHDGDKIAARTINIVREISLEEMILETVRLRIAAATVEEGATASGTRGAATASGDQGAATASGDQGAATASGDQGAATASGYQGAATASGTRGAATASGTRGAATASGYRGAATASGDQGAATASGDQGAATASGDQGAATASGTRGAATASGTRGAATASGVDGRARGKEGCALFLAERVDDWSSDRGRILSVWAGIVGRDGIKPDTFYRLVDGKPVEVV